MATASVVDAVVRMARHWRGLADLRARDDDWGTSEPALAALLLAPPPPGPDDAPCPSPPRLWHAASVRELFLITDTPKLGMAFRVT